MLVAYGKETSHGLRKAGDEWVISEGELGIPLEFKQQKATISVSRARPVCSMPMG